MALLATASIDVTKIPKDKLIDGKKGKYLNVTVSVNDETDQYGNNASIYVQQSKEEREAKEQRTYLGNGRVVWNNGNVSNAGEGGSNGESQDFAVADAEDDLPF
jgi:hypothetical protein